MVSEVGRGGMGAVWLCRDKVLGREVAVKQLGGLPGETAPALARALREARASAALNHPHVVAIYDAVEDGDHVWLVMEYVPSRTLSAVLSAEGALAPRRAAFICAQVADGLAAAHAHGTMHRDVKPGNILVADDDHMKLSDFGIARHVDDETLTQTGMVTGTPMYFSPQLARGMAPTPADDVWALGATLFTAVEGGPPWPEEPNAIAMLVHIAEHPPPLPRAAGPLAPLIEQMLSVDPSERPDMASVASQLNELAVSSAPPEVVEEHPTVAFAAPGNPPTIERPAAEPAPVDRPRRRRLLPLAAGVAALLLVAAIVAIVLTSGSDDEPGARSDRGQRTGGTAASDDASSGATSGSEPSADATTAPTSSTSQSTEDTTDAGVPSTTDPAEFVTDYYGLLPDDTKAAWVLLSDDMQAEVGSYGSYRGFWRTIDSVAVDGTEEESSGTVLVDLTYSSERGEESETRRITVEDTGDGLQIVGDEVA
jgi:serine/threonine protein kinase